MILNALLNHAYFLPSIGFSLGFALVMFLAFIVGSLRRAQIKIEASRIIEEATEKAREVEEACQKKAAEYSETMKKRHERENKRTEQRVEQISAKIQDRERRLDERVRAKEKEVSAHQSEVDIFDNQVQSIERRVEQKRQKRHSLLTEFRKRLVEKTEISQEDVIKSLQSRALDEKKVSITKELQTQDEEWQIKAESEAKKLLSLAINRFVRPYCSERGIGYLNFDSEEQKSRVLGPNQENLRLVEKLCGVDLAYDEQNNAVNVYGFDPVRRELGRATVDKMMKERQLDAKRIEQIVDKNKKDLFQRILNDGQRIANELKIEGLHPEVKNMMGALRYRYSFTQNQYFHCAEVGFLCGLLAAEIGVPLKEARRAGLLHDIGKAMDHSIEGGHAVIGADFIKQHGEAELIVHAVRAHHFDEQPDSELAYLVIAADAISGARPGARRSTVATYTQKIQDLQTIARGFQGVIDTHVLSAGREVRVYVDGRQVDDTKALDLSRDIAHKIEQEMQYPGQIRVTVVRETQAVEYAR